MITKGAHGTGISFMVGPAENVAKNGDESSIGTAVLAAISRSRFETGDFNRAFSGPNAAQSAGFKSYGDLERGAALVEVHDTADGV
jgi:hypothetical protein